MRTVTAALCTLVLGAQEPPLTVADAVASALASGPALKASESQADAARARQAQAGWRRAGTLEATGLYTPKQKPLQVDIPSFFPGMDPMSMEIRQLQKYSVTGTYTLPLWTWGALTGAHRAASEDAEAARRTALRSRAQTTYDARAAFHQAEAALAAVTVAEAAFAQQQAFQATARSRVAAGAAPRLDQLKAELAVAKAESDLLEARNRAVLAREALVATTLDPRFRTAPLKADPTPEGALPEEASALAQALQARPDLEATRRRLAALELGTRAARASGLPAVAFRASLTQQNDAPSQVMKGASQLYSVGLALSWDALEPGRARAKAAELEAQGRALRHGLRGQEEGVALEVRSALHRLREAQARLAVQARAIDVAMEQARIARLAYREGVSTSLEAQEAELALTAARFDHLRARTDAATAWAALELALGR